MRIYICSTLIMLNLLLGVRLCALSMGFCKKESLRRASAGAVGVMSNAIALLT